MSRATRNARLSDIAELAGMQTGSLYYHFDFREDLVAEILRLGIETSWQHVRDAVDALPAGATPLERLAAAIRAHTLCGARDQRLRLGPGPHRRPGAAGGPQASHG